MTFAERAELLSRPLQTRMVGGVGSPIRNRCPRDCASACTEPLSSLVCDLVYELDSTETVVFQNIKDNRAEKLVRQNYIRIELPLGTRLIRVAAVDVADIPLHQAGRLDPKRPCRGLQPEKLATDPPH